MYTINIVSKSVDSIDPIPSFVWINLQVKPVKAIVVYESLWGNTAAIAHAIAAGIGHQTPALNTSEAKSSVLAGIDLLVAGSPMLTNLITHEKIRQKIGSNWEGDPSPPDLSHPSLRAWLKSLPRGKGRSAAFETCIWLTFGQAAAATLSLLEKAGYRPLDEPRCFIVLGAFGPLRDGELETAQKWGAWLARAMSA